MAGRDMYEEIAAKFIAALEQGTAPWRKTWTGGTAGAPRNIAGRPYRGVNTFLLACQGYASPFWMTFNQARAKGWSVRKGQKGTAVIFWKLLDDEKSPVVNGEHTRKIPILRYFVVFNAEQVDGVPAKFLPAAPPVRTETEATAAAKKIADDFFARPGAPTLTTGGTQPRYSPLLDEMVVPPAGAFESDAAYYATLFHEMGHSTGHAKRLDRGLTGAFASHSYGREELVAEMTAAFLSADAGIADQTFDNSASYLASWIKTIKEDPKSIVWAAGRAQKAADLILDRDPAAESTDDEETKEAA